MLTRRSAAAAGGAHTHTYSSAASETAATKKAPGLLLLLPSLGPEACARMDTDTAACSSDNTPAGDESVPVIGCRLASIMWPLLVALDYVDSTQYRGQAASTPAALRVFLLGSPVACQTAT